MGGRWSRTPVEVSGDKGRLKTSKSSSKLETSTVSSFSLVVGWDKVATSSTVHWDSNAIFGMFSGIGLVMRKAGMTTLIWCKRGSFAFIMHFSA